MTREEYLAKAEELANPENERDYVERYCEFEILIEKCKKEFTVDYIEDDVIQEVEVYFSCLKDNIVNEYLSEHGYREKFIL
ncbi:MAG TPA: hypothetical protein IAC14_02020 [Candidatus Scybalomonas excrementigallinarum]|nr:hypothetical protein [Candidatus Scybalomonas excrementigallinarum]